MKNTLTLLLILFCLQIVKAQTYVTIPDANFVAWLKLKIPSAMSGNQMDISSSAVATRVKVDLSAQNITDLTGIQYFTSLDTFRYAGGAASVLPSLSNSVTFIDIFSGSFTSITSLPNSLKEFNCQDNQLTSLPSLPNTLLSLKCTYNQLSNLPALPPSLINLECPSNLLANLPTLPASITTIDCSNNQLTNLPPLPSSLLYLHCADNQLSGLPALPSTLTDLVCSNNPLIILPALPNSLIYLYCSNNQLNGLPVLPNLLSYLDCSRNQLSILPSLPGSLGYLNCSYNQLTNLPILPVVLNTLYCSYNQLASLPSLPVSIGVLLCDHNNITCFPPLPPIQFEHGSAPSTTLLFDISSNPFSCLPNYIPAMNAGTLNFPLCAPGNSNGCTPGKGITGIVYHDVNQDCNKSATEPGINSAVVKMYDNANTFLGLTSALVNKNYFINAQAGTYKVILDTVNKPYIVQCANPGIDSLITLTSSQLIEDSVDFAITCKPGFDVGFEWARPRFNIFPGVTHTLTVIAGDLGHWNDLYCASGISGTVTFTITGPITYVGPAAGALAPVVSGNVYSYNIADFGAVQNFTDFKLQFATNTSAQTGDQICVDGLMVTTAADYNLANNTYQLCYVVGNSYDPNKKEVYPKEVTSGFNDWLTYTIHFRNTGAAAAMNVRLLDTLESKLDPETFQVLSSSHSNSIDLTGSVLNVRFPNIQLSSPIVSQDGALGFFRYRIKPKANWINDTIRNKAGIYFDYNAPIVTNTAKTYFMTTTSIKSVPDKEQEFSLFPNPTNGDVTVTGSQGIKSIEVSTIAGQIILTKAVNAKEHQLQLQDFAEGIYFIKCTYANGMSMTRKIIKQ